MREILALIGTAARRAVRVYFAPVVWLLKGVGALVSRPFRRQRKANLAEHISPSVTRPIRP